MKQQGTSLNLGNFTLPRAQIEMKSMTHVCVCVLLPLFVFEAGSFYLALVDPGTHYLKQTGLKLRETPASPSRVLELRRVLPNQVQKTFLYLTSLKS